MVKVYHNKRTDFFRGNPEDAKHITEQDLVAIVKGDDLDDAYRLTNHIDEEWWKNREVECVKRSRSTSVGDFMEVNGEWFIVAPVGFDQVAGPDAYHDEHDDASEKMERLND